MVMYLTIPYYPEWDMFQYILIFPIHTRSRCVRVDGFTPTHTVAICCWDVFVVSEKSSLEISQ